MLLHVHTRQLHVYNYIQSNKDLKAKLAVFWQNVCDVQDPEFGIDGAPLEISEYEWMRLTRHTCSVSLNEASIRCLIVVTSVSAHTAKIGGGSKEIRVALRQTKEQFGKLIYSVTFIRSLLASVYVSLVSMFMYKLCSYVCVVIVFLILHVHVCRCMYMYMHM